jgi:hypothetical protein
MFSVFKPDDAADLVILVLDNIYKEEFDIGTHIVLSVSTKTSLEKLTRKISGLTKIAPDRIMLLFCGQVLSVPKMFIPADAFEASEVVDEDTNSFRPRLCMTILADLSVCVEEEDNSPSRLVPLNNDKDLVLTKKKVRKKNRTKGQFDLEKELSTIKCERFFDYFQEKEYDNDVSSNSLRCVLCYVLLTFPFDCCQYRVHFPAYLSKSLEVCGYLLLLLPESTVCVSKYGFVLPRRTRTNIITTLTLLH